MSHHDDQNRTRIASHIIPKEDLATSHTKEVIIPYLFQMVLVSFMLKDHQISPCQNRIIDCHAKMIFRSYQTSYIALNMCICKPINHALCHNTNKANCVTCYAKWVTNAIIPKWSCFLSC